MGAYTLTSASYKKDFNRGILLVAHIRSHIKEGNKAKHQGNITTFGDVVKLGICAARI